MHSQSLCDTGANSKAMGISTPRAMVARRSGWLMNGALLLLAACGGSSADGGAGGQTPQNRAPTISGSPPTVVTDGDQYAFTPSASDPDGDQLSFSISGQPPWTIFDDQTGTLQGVPGQNDVGVYSDIVISASDGAVNTSLLPFSITVAAITTGSVTLHWTAPSTNADGSMLNDLSGYIVSWELAPDALTLSETVDDPNTETHGLSGLLPGTYYFAVVAVDHAGNKSANSNVFSAIVL